jgi:putative hydrolase of the HAD superfamily
MTGATARVRQVDAMVFDLGGVILSSGSPDKMMQRYPAEHRARARAIITGDYGADTDHPWHRVERGEIPYEQCRAEIRILLAEAGIEVPERPPSNEPRQRTVTVNAAMVGLVSELRGAGIATALLTNNVAEFRPSWLAAIPVDELFDVVVDSSAVGMRKPNPAIYDYTLTRLGHRPERAAFLDDIATNTDAARRLGWHAIHVVDEGESAIAAARALAGL